MTSPIRTSESIDAIADAIAAAQAEFKPVEKTRQGKIEGESKGSGKAYSFTYAYADIADVLAMALPILAKNKIATIQPTVMDGGVLTIVTRLVHAGQWIESDYPVCSLNGDHKKMGGALTYARRYALCAMLGIAPDDDIDGNGADEPAAKQKPAPRTARGPESLPAPDMRNDNPFDDFPGDMPSKQVEPAVSTKAINMAREVKGCKSLNDLDALKKQSEFTAFWVSANGVDRAHVSKAAEAVKNQVAADMIGN